VAARLAEAIQPNRLKGGFSKGAGHCLAHTLPHYLHCAAKPLVEMSKSGDILSSHVQNPFIKILDRRSFGLGDPKPSLTNTPYTQCFRPHAISTWVNGSKVRAAYHRR
jgi:hypothetical protein